MEEELAQGADSARSEIKRQVVTYGLDAAPVAQALRQQEKPSRRCGQGGYTPDGLRRARMPRQPLCPAAQAGRKLARMWDHRPGVAPPGTTHSPAAVVQNGGGGLGDAATHERYAKEPDPWPKVREVLRAGLVASRGKAKRARVTDFNVDT